MTFFSHLPDFSDFPFLFPHFPYLCYVKCHIRPFPHKENTFLKTLFILSRASDNTTSINIGGAMQGPSGPVPHLKFWGDRPPSPPRSPPMHRTSKNKSTKLCESHIVKTSHEVKWIKDESHIVKTSHEVTWIAFGACTFPIFSRSVPPKLYTDFRLWPRPTFHPQLH